MVEATSMRRHSATCSLPAHRWKEPGPFGIVSPADSMKLVHDYFCTVHRMFHDAHMIWNNDNDLHEKNHDHSNSHAALSRRLYSVANGAAALLNRKSLH